MKIFAVVFNGYEPLDLAGPVEVLGDIKDVELHYVSLDGKPVTSRQGLTLVTESFDVVEPQNVLLVPGGMGTRTLVEDTTWLLAFATLVKEAKRVLTVCTGVALLAKTGALNHRRATGNKRAFAWVRSSSNAVQWEPCARWVHDDIFYTASGVSAGIDMALAFLRDEFGLEFAQNVARRMEYVWNSEADKDPFAVLID